MVIIRSYSYIDQYNGQEGVELAVKILEQELRSTMALAG